MNYTSVRKGIFLSRPNRFIARVLVEGTEETVHVKNTGRCKELLREGAVVYLQTAKNPARKTAFDLIAVEKLRDGKSPLLINMDSQIPNFVVAEWLPHSGLFSPGATIRNEVSYGSSRFDLYVTDGERRAFLEVKGVTLEQDGLALFPDAPTLRGARHMRELAQCVREGYEAYVIFLVQMKGDYGFSPNATTDPDFALALSQGHKQGVKVLCLDCRVRPDSIVAHESVQLML